MVCSRYGSVLQTFREDGVRYTMSWKLEFVIPYINRCGFEWRTFTNHLTTPVLVQCLFRVDDIALRTHPVIRRVHTVL